jgi:CheY-like chemotaxis protein
MSAKPVVFFIDDSATMREVIKIAFRREEMDVVTCHDASSAIDLMENTSPDVVITDVIMPGKDGYEVCQHVKQHARLAETPVILMSGVVNKAVAEKAFSVHANELIRKPFQPQDLITRVRHLLSSKLEEAAPAQQPAEDASAVLSSIFSGPAPSRGAQAQPPRTPAGGAPPMPPRSVPMPAMPAVAAAAASAAAPARAPQTPPSIAATAAAAMQPAVPAPPVSIPGAQITGEVQLPIPPAAAPARVPAPPSAGGGSDMGKIRLEILRLQSQIRKLEQELAAEREYSKALEQHVTSLQEVD